MSYYEPDDDYMTSEEAAEAGWIDPDTAADLVAYINQVEFHDPRPGSKSDAALIMIAMTLGQIPQDDPHVMWARTLLDLAR
jgi:hypothetical protein